ncbi:hypothetical protein T261_0108 [Streptomyces lydicus]|nr:hypothetical protein T261_0108 [Streptomyces lydicus]
MGMCCTLSGGACRCSSGLLLFIAGHPKTRIALCRNSDMNRDLRFNSLRWVVVQGPAKSSGDAE